MRFCLTLLITLVLCGACLANNDSTLSPDLRGKKIVVSDKSFFIGNRLLNGDELEAVLKTNDEAASAYSTAMCFYYPGMVLAYAGGAALGYGVVTWIWDSNSDLGMYMTLGSIGVIGLSLLLTRTANGYLLDAVDLFNKGVPVMETSVRLKIVPTEQGGIAVALAF